MALVKQADGSFELTVPLPHILDELLYKYVVDGEWLVADHETVTIDDEGNENNVLKASDLVAAQVQGSRIPEAGGLPVTSTSATGAIVGNDLKATVMPKEEPQQVSIAGEPGIAIPKGDTLAALEAEPIRHEDAKALNEQISTEDKKKQKKKVKRSQYKAKKKASKATKGSPGAAETVEESTEGADTSPEPEAKPEAKEDAVITSSTEPTSSEPLESAPVTNLAPAEVVSTEPSAPEVSVEPEQESKAVIPEVAPDTVADPQEITPESDKVVEEALTTTTSNNGDAASKSYHSLDPKAPEKEVTASPSKPNFDDDDEIVIAEGKGENIEQQILANENGDVTVEEIQPTASEREKLTNHAKLPSSLAATKKSTQGPSNPSKEVKKETKQDAKPNAKEEKKKKGGFFAKLKKIFN